MKDKFGYMLCSKGGSPLIIGDKYPIYYLLKIAKEEAIRYGACSLKKVLITEIPVN